MPAGMRHAFAVTVMLTSALPALRASPHAVGEPYLEPLESGVLAAGCLHPDNSRLGITLLQDQQLAGMVM